MALTVACAVPITAGVISTAHADESCEDRGMSAVISFAIGNARLTRVPYFDTPLPPEAGHLAVNPCM